MRDRGYDILARNHTTRAGELDLIVYDPDQDMIVFVEVRTRRDPRYPAELSVGYRKKNQLQKVGRSFLIQRRAMHIDHRYDVIGITLPEDEEPRLRHFDHIL